MEQEYNPMGGAPSCAKRAFRALFLFAKFVPLRLPLLAGGKGGFLK
jgi:hypothetical protein